MKLKKFLFPLILSLGFFISCKDEDSIFFDNEPIDISQAWEIASPKSVRLNASELGVAVNHAKNIQRMRSLLVIRNGKLVSENYFGPTDKSTLHDVRSVTKSIISTLTFIALEKGDLSSLDKGIDLGDQYPLSEDQQAITFRHLLSMTAGFLWDEWTNTSYNDWVVSEDEIQYIIDLPFASDPGVAFTYNSGAVHMLGQALEQEIGMTIPEYAEQELFEPLGIKDVQWEVLATGVNGGSGIDLQSRDLARIGQLYLQEGLSGDDQLLSPSSIDDLSRTQVNLGASFGSVSQLSYGFLWWTVKSPFEAYMAWGYGGQYIVVVPALKMVVVTTTDWTLLSAEGGSTALEQEVMDLVYTEILPAAK